jgi:hypothetical protein
VFDAGAIQAHLDVTLTEFDRKLTEAEARVKRFEDAKHEVKIVPVLDSSAFNEARQQFSRFDQQITREATQRARNSPQGSVLGSLSGLFNPKSAGGRVATSMKGVSPLIGAGLAAIPAAAVLGGVGLGAGIAGAGAFAAAGGALAAFGAIAKPVLSDALKAEQAVQKAQDAYNQAIANGVSPSKAYAAQQQAIAKAYTDMSPAQRALSQQLGKMAENWEKVKKAETPVVAGALTPWLSAITSMMTKLHPIVVAVSGVIGSLGKQFDVLVNSPAFTGFRNFIAGTGSLVVGEAGRSILAVLHGLMVLLPLFAPLIEGAARGVGHLADKFEAWAVSGKARTDVANFLKWFKENGPTVGRFIESIGGALKALAPGLTSGGLIELQVLTTFLNLVAKLPPGVAGPLAAIAGAALILAKLPGGTKVISFAVNLVGKGGAALLKWMTGGAINIGGSTPMQTAADTMVTASTKMQIAADTMVGAATEGTAGGAAGAAGGAAGGGRLSRLGRFAGKAVGGAALGAGVLAGGSAIVGATTRPGTTGQKWGQVGVDVASGAAAGAMFGPWGIAAGAAIGLVTGLVTQFHHQIAHIFDMIRHEAANIWDGMRHETMHIFDDMFGYTIGVAIRFGHNVETQFDSVRHQIAVIFDGARHEVMHIFDDLFGYTIGAAIRFAHNIETQFNSVTHEAAVIFDGMRHEVAHIWDMVWNNTIGRAERGAHDVAAWFDNIRHSTASKFDGIRHDIAHAWDVIYNNTIGALIRLGGGIGDRFNSVKNWISQHFITPVSNWFTKTLPNTFSSAVTLIGNAWDFIRAKISGPIRTVANATIVPLFKGIDTITNFVLGKNPLAGAIKTLQGLAAGGKITAGTSDTADDVVVRVSRNETVLSALHSRILAPALAALGVPGYASGGLVNPIGPGLKPERIDMGVDYGGSGPLYAIGSGTITNLWNSGWPGGTFLGLRLSPPYGSGYWFYAEDIMPLLNRGIHVGAGVSAGQYIADALGGPSGIEVGWAAPPGTGKTAAAAAGQAAAGQKHGDPGLYPTAWGKAASDLIGSLGGPRGILGKGPIQGGTSGIGFIIRTLKDIFGGLGNLAKVAIDLAHGDTGGAGRAMSALFPATKGGAGGGLGNLLMGLPGKLIKDTMNFLVKGVKSFASQQQSGMPDVAAKGPIQAFAKKLLAAYGWGSQWPSFNALEMSEAGWNPLAQNPTSTAFGLGQFLDSTWAAVGGTKTSNPYTQLQLMMKYISQSKNFHDPNSAWAFHRANNWYGDGGPINEPVIGFGMSGQSYVFGENGREWVSPAGPGGGPSGGAMIGNVHIQLPEGQTVARALSELTFWLKVAQQQGFAGVLPGG